MRLRTFATLSPSVLIFFTTVAVAKPRHGADTGTRGGGRGTSVAIEMPQGPRVGEPVKILWLACGWTPLVADISK